MPDTWKWCCPAGPHPDSRIHDGSLTYLQYQLNAFVAGEFMEYGVDIKRLRQDGQGDPYNQDVWSIRSHLMQPQLRLIGWFALPKMFVAVQGAVRDDLDSPRWNSLIAYAAEIRNTIVGPVNWYNEDPDKYL
jgi:hypothetical protein